jgi:hypothetical protein
MKDCRAGDGRLAEPRSLPSSSARAVIDAFWEGRCGSQGTARQQPATKQRKTLTPLHSVPEEDPRDPRARSCAKKHTITFGWILFFALGLA